MSAKLYKLKKPGGGVPVAWRTRPTAEHPQGQLVTATEPAQFDLDEYFPEGIPGNGREWFEAAEAPVAAPSAPPPAKTAPPAKTSGGKQ